MGIASRYDLTPAIRSLSQPEPSPRAERTDVAQALRAIQAMLTALSDEIAVLRAQLASSSTGAGVLVPAVLVFTLPAVSISSPVVVNNGLLVLRGRQDATGGRLVTFDPGVFGPTPSNIAEDPNALTVWTFIGVEGRWECLSVQNPLP
jgi:hypothetical protein